jgi:hypothetical protein
MNRHAALSICLALGLSSTGCEVSKASGSGVPGDKSVAEITDEDAKKVCLWLNENFSNDETAAQACSDEAVLNSETPAECRAEAKLCQELDDAAVGDDGADDADCSMAAAKDELSPGCAQITVTDFESCVKTLKKLADDASSGLTCENAGKDPEPFTLPAICKKIQTQCPEIAPFDPEGLDD